MILCDPGRSNSSRDVPDWEVRRKPPWKITSTSQNSIHPSERTQELISDLPEVLSTVLATLDEGIIILDGTKRLVAINALALRLHGFESEDHARTSYETLVGELKAERSQAISAPFSVLDKAGRPVPIEQWPLARAWRGERYRAREVILLNNGTGQRWTAEFTGLRLSSPDGESELFITTMRDITAQREAEREYHEARRRLQVLHEAVALVLASDEPKTLIDQVYQQLADVLGVEYYFGYADSGNERLRLIAYHGVPAEVAKRIEELKFGEELCGLVAKTRQPVVVEDARQRDDAMTEMLRSIGIGAYVAHPLIARGRLMGTLSFGSRRRRRFEPNEVALIRSVCDQVAIALERHHGALEVYRSGERLRLALDAAHLGAFEWDTRSDVLECDVNMCDVLGIPPRREIALSYFWQVVHPDDARMLQKYIDRQVNIPGEEFMDVEFRVARLDGEWRWVSAKTRVTRNADGKTCQIHGVVFDITERKRMEEVQQLAQSVGPVGTFYWDFSSSRPRLDPQLERMYGVDAEHPMSGFSAWLARVHPDDRDTVLKTMREIAAGNTAQWGSEFRIVRPNGEVRWVEARGAVTKDIDGRARYCYGINIDITERKNAEQALRQSEIQFRRLSESGIIGVAFFDSDGGITDANDRFLAMVGYSRDEMKQGLVRWELLTPPEWMPRTREALYEFYETGKISPYEKEYFRRNGERFWGLIGGAQVEGGGGVSFVLDITEQKRAEEKLKEANQHKDDFIAALGHELRNPLVPIRNAMEILRLKSEQDDKLRWIADVTERQVQQLTRLVDDLLDVSRINRGKIDLRKQTFDLANAIARAVEMSTPLIQQRNHRLRLKVPSEAAHVYGDADRLTQVFSNLLSNAAQYTPPGGTLHVTLEIASEQAIVCVRDNGIGIPRHRLKEIFEPFQQLRAPGEHSQAGLGLGLALVQRLVELHQGSVEAISDGPGSGSEFRVRLPLAQARRNIGGEPSRDNRTTAASRLRAVVVDDNHDVAESMVALLEMLGHEARPAYTGTEALTLARQWAPDLIICDIGLPDLSGYDVAAELRRYAETRRIRLVAVTGFGRDSERAMQSGFDEWLLKPVSVPAIEALLHRGLSTTAHMG
jgi:PAS domain S-box-containing protein